MKNIYFILYLISFTFCLTQCKKDEQRTIVEVIALDKTTNQTIQNARVILIADTFSTFMGPTYSVLIEEKYTDNSGKCRFDFMANKSWTYYFYSSAEHYYDLGDPIGDIEIGQMNYVGIPFQPEGFLKVFIKNIAPFDITDKIYVGSNDIDLGGYYYGMAVDTFTVGKTWGNISRELHWQVTKNGIINNYSTNVFVLAIDTTTYTINY